MVEAEELAAAAHDARGTCLSFRRKLCPPLNLSILAPAEQRNVQRDCRSYVALERGLPRGARFCGARQRRLNPCWSEVGQTYCLPRFYLLGEMKCGTTTLCELLRPLS